MKKIIIPSHWIYSRAIAIMFLLVVVSCSTSTKKPKFIAGDDTLTSGTIHISVDESFQPIMDSQLQVFLSQHPNAKIIAHYKPEAECMKDLLNDSIRMVITTRGLSEKETVFYFWGANLIQ